MMTLDAIARWIVPGLLNGIWQSFLMAGIFAFALHYIHSSASTRCAVWFLLLVATVLLPFLPPKTSLHKNQQEQIQSAAGNVQNENVITTPTPKIPVTVARTILLLWLVGAVIQIMRLFVGLRRLFHLKRNALPLMVPDHYPRNVRICSSDECVTPVVIGFRRPVILLPSKLAFSLHSADVNRILRHEIAHIVRRDDWTQFVQRVVEALFFFHPVILWIGRKLALEREIACDDHVIKTDSDIKSYAKSLIQLAELNSSSLAPAAAPAIFSHKNQLSRRIDMLLISNRNRNVRVSRFGAALVILLVAGFVLFMAQVSPVVAVSEKETKASKAQLQNVTQAEEELRRATEEMKRTSEKMQQALEQMKNTVEELRALTEERSVPALPPMPETPPLSSMPPLAPSLPAPPALSAPAVAPLPPMDATIPMPPGAKIIDPAPEIPEVPETPESRKRPRD